MRLHWHTNPCSHGLIFTDDPKKVQCFHCKHFLKIVGAPKHKLYRKYQTARFRKIGRSGGPARE